MSNSVPTPTPTSYYQITQNKEPIATMAFTPGNDAQNQPQVTVDLYSGGNPLETQPIATQVISLTTENQVNLSNEGRSIGGQVNLNVTRSIFFEGALSLGALSLWLSGEVGVLIPNSQHPGFFGCSLTAKLSQNSNMEPQFGMEIYITSEYRGTVFASNFQIGEQEVANVTVDNNTSKQVSANGCQGTINNKVNYVNYTGRMYIDGIRYEIGFVNSYLGGVQS